MTGFSAKHILPRQLFSALFILCSLLLSAAPTHAQDDTPVLLVFGPPLDELTLRWRHDDGVQEQTVTLQPAMLGDDHRQSFQRGERVEQLVDLKRPDHATSHALMRRQTRDVLAFQHNASRGGS